MAFSRGGRIPRERGSFRRPPFKQRVVIAIPSGLTLANLFFGVFAIVTAARGDFFDAGLYVVFGGVADMLDGRIARATNTGSRFGAELDSLVDLITFGVAPAMIMYHAILKQEGWDWIWAFIYIAAVAWRLAVFNVEQAGQAKRYFHGLPSPAAGITLATYYWFSQTALYTETNIVNLPWYQMMHFVMLGLAALMISPIPYPAFPSVGYKTNEQRIGSLIVIGVLLGVFLIPGQFFFPACMIYIAYGLFKTVLLGLLNKRAPDDSSTQRRDFHRPHHHHSHHSKDRTESQEQDSGEPSVAISSAPRLSVSADTQPASDAPVQRRRRRRRPPRRDNPSRPNSSPDNPPEE